MRLDRRTTTVGLIVMALAGSVAVWFTRDTASTIPAVPAGGMAVTHASGTTMVPANPRTVVVFDPSALDALDALGGEVAGVSSGRFPAHLVRYSGDAYPKVGTLFEPDMEAIAGMRPDLIIVGARSSQQYEPLSRMALTLDLSIDRGEYIESTIHNTELLGSIFGKDREAAEAVQQLRASVAALRERTAGAGRGLVLLTTGGRMSAFGAEEGSRFGFVYGAFGVAPAVQEVRRDTHGNSVSAEFIREVNPDWLFVIDRDDAIGRLNAGGRQATDAAPQAAVRRGGRGGTDGAASGGTGGATERGVSARQTLDNPLIAETTAWKRGQVVYLDPLSWYIVGGGIQTVRQMAEEIGAAMERAADAPGGVVPGTPGS